MKKLVLLLPMIALFLPFATDGHAAALHLKPSLCAIDEGEERCVISVSVEFIGDDRDRYCLSVAGEGVVHCFVGTDRAEIEVAVKTDSDTQFLVTRQNRSDPVASAVLKVARFRPARHQRRYGWGLL